MNPYRQNAVNNVNERTFGGAQVPGKRNNVFCFDHKIAFADSSGQNCKNDVDVLLNVERVEGIGLFNFCSQ